MKTSYEVPATTRERQARASDPMASAWVSANAGAGKTTVLVRRVIRLLLAGSPPARILCLTFTKAAAAHMANEVLETLRKWVRLDDDALDRELAAVDPMPRSPERRATARRLFALALETPGGLKVQTIHAFCDRLLHQFPFEARVPAGFTVLDEVEAADLFRRARDRVMVEAARDPEGPLANALALAVSLASDTGLDRALDEAIRARRLILRLAAGGIEESVAAALGLKEGHTVSAIEAEILEKSKISPDEWTSLAETLQPLGGNAAKCGARLAAAAQNPDVSSALDNYLEIFRRSGGESRPDGDFGSAAVRSSKREIFDRLFAERDRVVPLAEKRLAARACERSVALLTLAGAAIRHYERAKRARGFLDYDDLIERAEEMLQNCGSLWVLYKLDQGIDHVLIDEAQDTSPGQWNVIGKLTEEFFSGRGARENVKRTVFAVGDDKQSIFSFQGADPAGFDRMRAEFRRRAEATGARFVPEQLDLSFRSAPNLLSAIDAVFARPDAFRGLSSGEEIKTAHTAIRSKAPALVEIWPTVKPVEDEDDGLAWDAPLDARSIKSAPVRLAQSIAKAVKFWTGGGIAVADERRPARAGDVIVLVRRRGILFEAILQALKRAGVPVAGADRLKLTDHIAVMDLIALGDVLTLGADDLALACVLKSPLFGFSEDDLFALAHGRAGTLLESLAECAANHSRFKDAAERLRRWRKEGGELRPFDFYSRLLGRDGGRALILGRLGEEAADALDEFLSRALVYETTETPSLVGFLAFLRRTGTEVKRDLEIESEAVRVMTVHGAKGLEAPIVVLADTTAMPDGRHDSRLLPLPTPPARPDAPPALAWMLDKDSDSRMLAEARRTAREARTAEYRRLLYVALTRAADALVVCGCEAERQSELPAGCWYRLVHDALKGAGSEAELVATEVPYFEERVWRWRPEAMEGAAPAAKPPAAAVELKPWLHAQLPASARLRRIVPSMILPEPFARERASAAGLLDARRRGDLIHRLLQSLPDFPAEERKERALRFLIHAASDLPAATRDELAAEAMAVLDHPDMAALLGPQSRAELDILARLPDFPASEIAGRIDRMVIRPDAVLIADFKTDANPPPGPEKANERYVAQLALYRAAVGRIYPGRPVRVFLVWTAKPAIHELPSERLDAALQCLAAA